MPKIIAERRDKRVMFRLSEEEHEKLRRICLATQQRSVSELVRQAVEHWLERGGIRPADDLQERVKELEDRMDSMTARIKVLNQSM